VRPPTRLTGSALAAVALYALMWAGAVWDWSWLAQFDAWALQPMYRFGQSHPGWVHGWDVFCTIFGPAAFRLATLVVIIVALARRNVRVAVFLVISVELAGLLTEAAKALVDRPRPDTAMVSAYGSSFPSGHALGVMVSVSALLAVAFPVIGASRRGWLLSLGVVLVVAVGVGRVVLNVHHPSDVIAGWALGYAYFVTCLLLVSPRRPVTQPDEIPAAPGSPR
jgi:undecaprenyl-diphosphatase